MLSLRRGESFARRRQNSTTDAIRISTTTGVPVGSLIAPPLLTGVRARQCLREDPNASRDEELPRKLFGDVNCDILRPSGDGKIIIIDDSDDNDEAQEEKTADIESTAAPTSADDAPAEARIDNSDDQGPGQEADGSANNRRSADDP
jgi:hypothetical protein